MKFKFHHIGQVTKNIKAKYNYYEKLGYAIRSGYEEPQLDSNQKVYVGVIDSDQITIELLTPSAPDSPLSQYLQKNGDIHHTCYEVENLDAAIEYFQENKLGRQITPVTISVWEQRPVTFFVDEQLSVFELIGSE